MYMKNTCALMAWVTKICLWIHYSPFQKHFPLFHMLISRVQAGHEAASTSLWQNSMPGQKGLGSCLGTTNVQKRAASMP
jgi:hypothetical protein